MREPTERKHTNPQQTVSSPLIARAALSGCLYTDLEAAHSPVDRPVRIGPATGRGGIGAVPATGRPGPRWYRWLNGSRVPATTRSDIAPRVAWPT